MIATQKVTIMVMVINELFLYFYNPLEASTTLPMLTWYSTNLIFLLLFVSYSYH